MFRLNSAASGLVALVTQPMWPAIADAVARHDSVWARRAYHRASWLTAGYAAAYAVGLVTGRQFGGPIVDRSQRGRTASDDVPVWPVLRRGSVGPHKRHHPCGARQGLGSCARRGLEAAVSALGAMVLVAQFGATGVILCLLIATASVSAALMPLCRSVDRGPRLLRPWRRAWGLAQRRNRHERRRRPARDDRGPGVCDAPGAPGCMPSFHRRSQGSRRSGVCGGRRTAIAGT